ncbi:transmembrane channel-like protein 6 isoform X1 [Gallus gallus]|uniref:transmembrane channel-like protein 6 isoform X1 n=1 Tax=Gallus gallus TaxID=9031 RepID=UPI001AE5A063|nr:transmembrane channel-like protein 6 isoform X1 [Gallus gallus]XP_040542551.1 transmembrane channel-like protein 6 isoform X1 [Gallus gallus]XP_040542553.1 transmembrane channel-like protein 6 isoform X1 [Gallus gallus]
MSRLPTVTLRVPENTESDGREPSPDNEGALHSSFCQLIEEQSSLVAGAIEMELQERGREPSALLPPPHPMATTGLEPEQGEQHPGYATTLRILANMPSRTIGRSRGAILSQYYNRTARLRRRSSRPSLQQLSLTARSSLRHYDLESDPAHSTLADKQSLLELLSLPPAQRSHMLLEVPLSLEEKRSLRRQLSQKRSTPGLRAHSADPTSPCAWCQDCIVLGCRTFWYRFLALVHTAQPWHYALKQIGGRFGSSVLSYFLFLKMLLMLNIFSFLLLLVFVVALQAAYPPAVASPRPFTGLEFLTGAGSFTHSLLYYGYYSNTTLNDPSASSPSGNTSPPRATQLPYNMPLAYVFTIGASFFATCILLMYSIYHSFGKSYHVGSSTGVLAIKVFCAWDFKVVQRRSVKLQSENICTQLKELLAEQRLRSCPLSLPQRLRHITVLLLAWLLALGTVLGCVVAVHYFSEHMHVVQQEQGAAAGSAWQQEGVLLALPLIVSLLNTLMPHFYNLLAAWEKQDSPGAEVYVAICRNLLLKMVVLGLLCYQWLSRRVVCSAKECWETCVGQDLYRFVVMDFIFTLLDTGFGELLWRLILEKKLKSKQKPEFDIARNVLELIYGQTLTWLGVLFAPLLPAVQVLKLLLLFYIKKTSLMQNCQSPSKPWQASHMSTVFITLLFFPSFLGAAVFVSYTIWSVKPSETCGPFQGLQTIYQTLKVWVELLEESNPNIAWFSWIPQYLVENTIFLFFLTGVVLAIIYLNIHVLRGQHRIIRLLEEQIANEGEDKRFLIRKIRSIYEHKEHCA